MAQSKYYYITLCREYNENSSTYVVLGTFNDVKTFRKALTAFTNALMLGNNEIKSINCYKRQDASESWYITVK